MTTRLIVLFALLWALMIVAPYALAVEIAWENPTQYTNGAPLELQEFQRFDLSCSTTAGNRQAITATWIETTPRRTLADSLFARGVPNYCALRVAVLGATATNGQIVTSDWSNEVSFTLPILRPNPPANLAVIGE